MRNTFRTLLGSLLFIFTVLSALTYETVADELGYTGKIRAIVRGGWSAVVDAGYASWVQTSAIFFAGAVLALLVDGLIRRFTTVSIVSEKKIKKIVKGQSFYNTELPLDGIQYEACKFQNVTLRYNGGVYRLFHNEFRGLQLTSDVKVIAAYVSVLGQFGFLSKPVFGPKGQVEFTGVTEVSEAPGQPPKR